eukprot:641910-Pelagomonas_calceolata.AAC.2
MKFEPSLSTFSSCFMRWSLLVDYDPLGRNQLEATKQQHRDLYCYLKNTLALNNPPYYPLTQ